MHILYTVRVNATNVEINNEKNIGKQTKVLLLRLNITLESMVLFSEDHIQETKRRGRIEVICGSMFSGKTEELIRRLKRAKFAKQRVEIFKPAIDTRYSEADVVSHDSHSIASTPIDSSASILLFTSEIDVVALTKPSSLTAA